MKSLSGIVHGKTIELADSPGFADGERVEVFVRKASKLMHNDDPAKCTKLPGPPPGWYPGCTETAAGMGADWWTEQDDRILAEIQREREDATHREIED